MKVSVQTGRKLLKELQMELFNTFSNNEPSELCSEYRMETGYGLDGIDEDLVRFKESLVEDYPEEVNDPLCEVRSNKYVMSCRLRVNLSVDDLDEHRPQQTIKSLQKYINALSDLGISETQKLETLLEEFKKVSDGP